MTIQTKLQITKELAIRELKKRHSKQRSSIIDCLVHYFKEELNKDFQDNWHYREIENKLLKVLKGEITRLIINVPPGSGKTEIITKFFPVWALATNPQLQFIVTGYSASLTQSFASEARDYYKSKTLKKIFPEISPVRKDQDTKSEWKNEFGGKYYATGAGGSITGHRANIFIIDDPIKPDEALSDVKRTKVNRWYDNTVVSRLFNPLKDAIIIIMQRTHEDDLCGHLMYKEQHDTGEKWDTLILPAIATEDEKHRKAGEALQKNRYPIEALDKIKKSYGEANFSAQYQQDPVDKEAQYFHEEFFNYFVLKDLQSMKGRYFTIVDPAFSEKKSADYTAIVSGCFVDDKLYICEVTNTRDDVYNIIKSITYHVQKWRSEKLGIEGVAAQIILIQMIQKEFRENGIYCVVEKIMNNQDKESKIRSLLPYIRQGLLFWQRGETELEHQLIKFPRGKHDDIIDAIQMFYSLFRIRSKSSTGSSNSAQNVNYNRYGLPI